MIKASAFIQRGALKVCNRINETNCIRERTFNNFLKNYLCRKEKRESKEAEKFFSIKRTPSQFNSETEFVLAPITARSGTRHSHSRLSSTRSSCWNK